MPKIELFVKKYYNLLLFALGSLLFIPVLFAMLPLMANSALQIPLWVCIICFTLSIIFYMLFIFIELKKDGNKKLYSIGILLIAIIVYSIIIILLQSDEVIITATAYYSADDKVGHLVDIITTISATDKTLFIMYSINIFIVIYSLLFLVPNIIKNKQFVKWFCILSILFTVLSIILSIALEWGRYIEVFKYLFAKQGTNEVHYPESFFGHKNMFGFVLMFGASQCLILYTLSKNKLIIIPYLLFGFEIFVCGCRTGLLIYIIMSVVTLYRYLIIGTINKKKKSIITLIILSVLLCSLIIVFIALYFSLPYFKAKVDSMLDYGTTFIARINIWKNAIYSLQPSWYLTGRGNGTFNKILINVNYELRRDMTYSTHGWIMAMLGRGGIPYLLSFIAFITYIANTIKNYFKKSSNINLTFIIVLFAFFIFSFFEDFYYILVLLFSEYLIIINSIDGKEKQETNNLQSLDSFK